MMVFSKYPLIVFLFYQYEIRVCIMETNPSRDDAHAHPTYYISVLQACKSIDVILISVCFSLKHV